MDCNGLSSLPFFFVSAIHVGCMALNSLSCADVPLKSYSLTTYENVVICHVYVYKCKFHILLIRW